MFVDIKLNTAFHFEIISNFLKNGKTLGRISHVSLPDSPSVNQSQYINKIVDKINYITWDFSQIIPL